MGRSGTKPRRSWWQLLARALALAAIFAAAGYVTLPVWVPAGYLKDRIAKQLAEQTQLEVTIGELSISWATGLELRGLEIRSPGDNLPMAMVSIRRISAEFNPITYFLFGEIEWLEIAEPNVFVDIDEEGKLNIAALAGLKWDVQAKRISVHQGHVIVRISGSQELLRMAVTGAEYVAGSDGKLGRMTVSATLDQKNVLAPISMRLSGGDVQAIAAKAVMNFSHLDLAKLPLIDLLELPLAGLAGECRGSLDLSMNHQGVVERFVLDVSINGLDVKPIIDLELPVIDDAGLHLAAAYDPVKGNLDIQSASIRLPGIDLSGSGSVFSDLGEGHLQAVNKLDLSGTIYPDRIMALMPHLLSLPGELETSGPVSVVLGVKLENNLFDLAASFDAAKAEVTWAGKVVKPLDREFTGSILAHIDTRTWQMTIPPRAGIVTLGGNSLRLEGTVDDVRRLGSIESGEPAHAAIIRCARLLSGIGELEISELESLAPLLEIVNGWELESAQLKGLIAGSLAIHRETDTVFAVSINIPAETELLIGDLLTKRAQETDSPWSARITGKIDSEESSIRDVSLNIKTGDGRIGLADGQVSFADDASGEVQASASLVLDNIESLLAISPYLQDAFGDLLAGRAIGNCEFLLKEDSYEIDAQLDLSELAIRADSVFVKPKGDTCRFDIFYEGDELAGSGARRVHLEASFEKAHVLATLTQPAVNGDAILLNSEINISDSGWLVESSPALADWIDQLGRDGLDGRIEITTKGTITSDTIDLNINCLADEITLAAKDTGQVSGANGKLAVVVQAVRTDDGLLVSGTIDGGELSVDRIGPVTKPKGIPARADFELSIPDDLKEIQLNSLEARLGGLYLSGRAIAAGGGKRTAHFVISTDNARSLAEFVPLLAGYDLTGGGYVEGDVIWDDESDPLVQSALVKADDLGGRFNGKDVRIGGQLALSDVRLWKEVRIGGQLALSDVRPWEEVMIGSLVTTDLELRAGQNHCWLTADLTDLHGDTSGRFVLLAEMLDDKDLIDWLGGSDESETNPEARSVAGEIPYRRLSDDEKAGLIVLSEDLLEGARPFLTRVDITGRVSIACLRTYDPSVARFYDVHNVEIDASLSDGHLKMAYVAGMNGGTLRDNYDVRLDDPSPVLAYSSTMDDVVATENIQPQLAKFFPGNTVGGLFNRDEKATIPLVDRVANIIDHNYPLHPIGQAKTVTTDGIIEGRAAPKFVTRVFTGLNLTKYRYDKMTSFATFRPDGIAENDMVFSGSIYDLYIEGTTDTENIGRYQVGLILLGTPQSAEWNHRYKQVRIPVLKLKARIEGGKMHDEVVSYPWPNESLFVVFLKNNIFYRIWVESRKKT